MYFFVSFFFNELEKKGLVERNCYIGLHDLILRILKTTQVERPYKGSFSADSDGDTEQGVNTVIAQARPWAIIVIDVLVFIEIHKATASRDEIKFTSNDRGDVTWNLD